MLKYSQNYRAYVLYLYALYKVIISKWQCASRWPSCHNRKKDPNRKPPELNINVKGINKASLIVLLKAWGPLKPNFTSNPAR